MMEALNWFYTTLLNQIAVFELVDMQMRKTLSVFELDIMGLHNGYSRFWLVGQREVLGEGYSVYYASGNGGNIMAIVPKLDLVIAIQQSAYGQGYPHFRAFSAIDGIIKAAVLDK